MKITHVDTMLVQSPFHEINVPHMHRGAADWSVVEICRVATDTGVVGFGETIIHYTWSRVTDGAKKRVIGRDPFEEMWDDSLGAGLQMALFDAAGKAIGQPCHRLLGRQVRDACPISYWDLDMPPEEWAAEAQRAVSLGYTSFKLKARPWRDIFAQVAAVCEVVPPWFKLDLDFNALLLNAGYAIPILRELEQFPNVAFFETPIPQGDVAGGKQIKARVSRPIAHHYGNPPIMTALAENVCDGFVLCTGASGLLRQGTVAAEANKPFWLQLVGTGITTAWAMHFGAVLTHARWPAITCSELYQDDLLNERLEVRSGYVAVPTKPGLGVELDEGALERLRVEEPRRIRPYDMVRVCWPDGRQVYYADRSQCQADFLQGNQPLFVRGVRLELLPDDGSAAFARRREATQQGPVVE